MRDGLLTFVLGPRSGTHPDLFGPGVRCNWSASAGRGVHSGCRGRYKVQRLMEHPCHEMWKGV